MWKDRGVDLPDRELFEAEAVALYDRILVAGEIGADSPALAADGADRRGFELLKELGLITCTGDDRWTPVDPATVQARVVGPLGQRGAEMLRESAEWAQSFTSLAQRWRRSPEAMAGPCTEVRGAAIDPFISGIVADAEFELLTAQPQTGHAKSLAAATRRDTEALKRGVAMRTLYQHAARRQTTIHRYVATVTGFGAEVRTQDEFFKRLIVVDRRVALVPTADGAGALAVREPSMVAYLVDMFERSWERARPFAHRDQSEVSRAIAAEQRAMTIRMLVAGHADSVSAKRLGVSPRTYAGYVADLKEEFEVDSRFQLGYELALAGLSGQEVDDLPAAPGQAATGTPSGSAGSDPTESAGPA